MSNIYSNVVRKRLKDSIDESEIEAIEPGESTGVAAFDVQDPDAICDALLDLAVRVTKLERAAKRD